MMTPVQIACEHEQWGAVESLWTLGADVAPHFPVGDSTKTVLHCLATRDENARLAH